MPVNPQSNLRPVTIAGFLKLSDSISQKLAKGEYLYCSGGGFAVAVIAEWLIRYLSNGIDGARIKILDEPQHVNLAGLKHLDIVV